MSQNEKDSNPVAETRLARIGERKLPPRVRALLEGVLERTAYFEPALGAMFDDAAQQLFKRADRANSNEQQSHMFETIREIRRGKSDVFPRLLVHLESSLALLDQPVKNAKPDTSKAPRRASMKLELVEASDLEISLAIQDIAHKAEIRHHQSLHVLGHRFGVIAGQAPLEPDVMPLAPMALIAAFEYSLANFDLDVNDRIGLFQAFDRIVMSPIGMFYDIIDQYLIAQRVLPNLRFRTPRAGRAENSTGSAAESTQDRTEPPAEADNTDLTQRHTPSTGQNTPAFGHAQAASAAGNSQQISDNGIEAAADRALFSSLRNLLAERRQAVGSNETASASSYQASRDDLQAVLGALQKHPVGVVQQDGRLVSRGIGHLKQDVLNQLRAKSPAGQAPALAQEDSDTIDLVGMLFDYIGQNLPARNGAHELMTKLQVPVLRTAIRDKEFFTQRQHPARVLLNSVAEASSLWLGEDDADRGLLNKMTSMVDRISQEFDGDMSVIDTMLGELGQYMGQVTRRAEMTERRHVDAAKGREKLELARQRANAVVARLLSRSKPQPMVRAVLEQAWTDVLALTLLRQGEESQSYRRCLAVADQLLQIGTGTDIEKIDTKVRDEVRSGLLQVGLHSDEVDGVVGKLFDPTNLEKKTSHTEIALALKSKPRLGGEAAPAESETDEPIAEPVALNAEEREMLQRIHTLPFGTWFEFVTNQQGDAVRRKLAWFSTVTGRCLFVNQRGARADERTMEQLARDLVRGQVRLYESDQGSFIDRAWKAITNTLQQFTSRGTPTAAVPSPA